MTFAVAGVSGNTGKVVAEILLEQKKKVRVIVRTAEKGAPWKAKGADIAVADLGDPGALGVALSGCDGAYLLIPPNMGAPDFGEYQRRTGESIVEAVKKSQVKSVAFLSSVGAQRDAGTGPILGLHWAEEALRKLAGPRLSFIRAAYFMENLGMSLSALGQGLLPSFMPAKLSIPMIATRDIGRVAANALLENTQKLEIIELGAGPYSMEDAASILSKLTGKTIKVQEAPLDAVVGIMTKMGVPKQIAGLYQEMIGAIISKHVSFEGTHRAVSGTVTLQDVLKAMVPSK